MKNLIRFGAILPIAGLSLLGLSNQAQAALLTGSTLNFVGGIQSNGTGNPAPNLNPDGIPIATPVLPTGEFAGGANGYTDFLWVPTLPGNFNSTSLSASNRVINSSVGPVVDAKIGTSGRTVVPLGVPGTLSFSALVDGTPGTLLNFDVDPANYGLFDCNAGDGSDCLLTMGDFRFGVFLNTLTLTAGGGPGASSGEFLVNGIVEEISTGMTAPAELVITFNGVFDNGVDGSDPVAGDFVTGVGSYSATWTIVQAVPEPSSVVALASVALVGGLMSRFKSRKF